MNPPMRLVYESKVYTITKVVEQFEHYRTLKASHKKVYFKIPKIRFYFTNEFEPSYHTGVGLQPVVFMEQEHEGLFRSSMFTSDGCICWGKLKFEDKLSENDLISLFWNSSFEVIWRLELCRPLRWLEGQHAYHT